VKEVEMGGQGHTSVSLLPSACHVTPCCEHALFLHEWFFDFMFHFVCNGWQNQAMCLHQVLHKAQYGQQLLNGIHVSWLVECQLKMMNVQGDQAPAK
jgi:hypothetical protein